MEQSTTCTSCELALIWFFLRVKSVKYFLFVYKKKKNLPCVSRTRMFLREEWSSTLKSHCLGKVVMDTWPNSCTSSSTCERTANHRPMPLAWRRWVARLRSGVCSDGLSRRLRSYGLSACSCGQLMRKSGGQAEWSILWAGPWTGTLMEGPFFITWMKESHLWPWALWWVGWVSQTDAVHGVMLCRQETKKSNNNSNK